MCSQLTTQLPMWLRHCGGGAGKGEEKSWEVVEKAREQARECERRQCVEVAQHRQDVSHALPWKPSSLFRQSCNATLPLRR
jgi:hypothetical protein